MSAPSKEDPKPSAQGDSGASQAPAPAPAQAPSKPTPSSVVAPSGGGDKGGGVAAAFAAATTAAAAASAGNQQKQPQAQAQGAATQATPQGPSAIGSAPVGGGGGQASSANVPQSAANPNFASPSLYVGDLGPDVNEGQLYEQFNAVGPVASIRVCRDSQSRQSLGYAYVNFQSVADAERALDTMNFTKIRGRPCRIMWSQRDPALRKSGKGNIFVKNLHESITDQQLHDTFSVFGNILSCKIQRDENGNSLRYGYVHYADEMAARQAIESVNGMLIANVKVVAEEFKPAPDRQADIPWTNVYFKHMPEDWDEDRLKNEIAQVVDGYGDDSITSLFWKKVDMGVFACVNFKTHELARDCVEKLNGKEVAPPSDDGDEKKENKLYVARSQKRRFRTRRGGYSRPFPYGKKPGFSGINLYVKNLSPDCNNERLKQLFQDYGKITSAKVMTDPNTGTSRLFGFVCFERKEDAVKAMTEMNGKTVDNKPLYVSRAQRKAVRAKWLQRQRQRHSHNQPFTPYSQRAPVAAPKQQQFQQNFGQQNFNFAGAGGGGSGRGPVMQYPMTFPQAQGLRGPQLQGPQLQAPIQPIPPIPPIQPQLNPLNVNPGVMNLMQPFTFPNLRPAQFPTINLQGFAANPALLAQAAAGLTQAATGTGFSNPQNAQQVAPQNPQVGSATNLVAPQGLSGPLAHSSIVGSVPMTGSVPVINFSTTNMSSAPQAMYQTKLTEQELSKHKQAEQKRMIGERLFPLVSRFDHRLAGKITGMLLEMDNKILLHYLDNNQALMKKVNEALQVLKEHQQASAGNKSVKD